MTKRKPRPTRRFIGEDTYEKRICTACLNSGVADIGGKLVRCKCGTPVVTHED